MHQHRGLLNPEDRARIIDIQDALLDRFCERDEAVAQGQDTRATELQVEIDDLLREGEEIKKWATVGSA